MKSVVHVPEEMTDVMLCTESRNGSLGIRCLEGALLNMAIRGLHKLRWKGKRSTIRTLACGVSVRDMLEDMCM